MQTHGEDVFDQDRTLSTLKKLPALLVKSDKPVRDRLKTWAETEVETLRMTNALQAELPDDHVSAN